MVLVYKSNILRHFPEACLSAVLRSSDTAATAFSIVGYRLTGAQVARCKVLRPAAEC
jgi:hypothetical protein